jgi:multidrug efflux system membrane fusion protein
MFTFGRLVCLSLVAGFLATGCGRGQGAASPASKGPGLSVRVAPVESRDVVYRIRALGSLEAEELVQVTAEVQGAVDAVFFHEGDRVTADTVLLKIDPERYRIEAAEAEANYKKASADAERAAWERKRREELAEEQLVAAEELNRARQEAERLAAEAAATKASWEWARENLRRSDVRAPQAGVINTRTVSTGQYVSVGAVLATLVDTTRLRLRFKVSDAESLQAHEGETVTFRVTSLGGHGYPARIYHVGEVADAATRQVEVLAWVRNPGELKPGFFAEVNLATGKHEGALVVGEGAVQASEQGFVAYVVENGKARQRPIQVGLRTGDGAVEILSGLRAGETVVVEGSDRLADGVEVQALTAPVRTAAEGPPREAGATP